MAKKMVETLEENVKETKEEKTTEKKTNFTESFVVDVTGEYHIKVANENTAAYINFTGLKWTSAE